MAGRRIHMRAPHEVPPSKRGRRDDRPAQPGSLRRTHRRDSQVFQPAASPVQRPAPAGGSAALGSKRWAQKRFLSRRKTPIQIGVCDFYQNTAFGFECFARGVRSRRFRAPHSESALHNTVVGTLFNRFESPRYFLGETVLPSNSGAQVQLHATNAAADAVNERGMCSLSSNPAVVFKAVDFQVSHFTHKIM